MKKSLTDIEVDINLFQSDLKDINREFIRKIVSIFKLSWSASGYLFTTNTATYVYGEAICKWLSLTHDPKLPQNTYILNDNKVIQFDSGKDFVVVLTNDGGVYLARSEYSCWKTFYFTFNCWQSISTKSNDCFEMIACGRNHLLLLRQDGTVFALGSNNYGQSTGNSQSSFKTLVNTGLKNVKIIACGEYHSLAVTNTNEIYSWGYNGYGQLGLGDTNNRTTPSLVSFPNGSTDSPIKNIVAGNQHSLFLLEDGQIFGCGYGQRLINDNMQDAMVPIKISIENVQSVACKNHLNVSMALDQSSQYYAWGIMNDGLFSSPKKLDGPPESFAAASAMINKSPITYGLTSTVNVLQSNNPISFIALLNNPDNYDVEFVIDDKRILASKCYLKIASQYYGRMFSGKWLENTEVVIKDYSYDVYYAYLVMLHNGRIRIDQFNIFQLIDLANCYNDQQLMKQCHTFIQNNLNERTLFTYFPLINKYQLDDVHDILVELTIENVWPKIADNLKTDKTKIVKFLELVLFEQQSLTTER